MFLINPFIYGSGSVGGSISFDGVDEYVDLGRVTMTESVANLSISCWVKVSTLSEANYIFGKYLNSTNGIFVSVEATTGRVSFGNYNGSTSYSYSSDTLSIDTWYHLAFVYDGTIGTAANRCKTYINGSLQSLSIVGTFPTTTTSDTADFALGALGGLTSANMSGKVDEFSIFDYSLTQTEVTAIYNSGCPNDLMELAEAKRPEHYYRFENVTFPTVPDLGQTGGNNGTMTNGESTDIVTNTPCGFNNYSLAFDGVDEYLDLGRLTMLESAANFSVSMWWKSSAVTKYFGRFASSTDNFYVNTNGTTTPWKINATLSNGGGAAYTRTNSVTAPFHQNQWNHVCVVYDGSLTGNLNRLKIFVNGINGTALSSGTIPATTSSDTQSFYTGAINNVGTATNFDNSQQDEFSFFDYSLSASEVTALYNSGAPNDLMELAAAKQPEHYYRMGDNDTFPTISDIGATGTNDGTMTNMESTDINGDVPLENN